MDLEVLIFDWSGVISDDRKPVYEANMKIIRKYGKPVIPFEEWLSRTTMTPIEFLEECGIHENHEKLFKLYKKYYDETVNSGVRPKIYPDIYDTLQHFKKAQKRLAVLSSHPKDNLKREAEEYKLLPFFELILGSSRDKSEGLKNILMELNIKPENTLYTGDTIYDIRAAKKSGVHSAGICTGYHSKGMLEGQNPEFLLACFSDLRHIEMKQHTAIQYKTKERHVTM